MLIAPTGSLEKSTFTPEYKRFLEYLRATRKRLGLSQEAVAENLGTKQAFVSRCELGERRLDVIELRWFCQAMGVGFEEFISGLETALQAGAGE